MSLILKKNSSWYEDLNGIITHRTTRAAGKINVKCRKSVAVSPATIYFMQIYDA